MSRYQSRSFKVLDLKDNPEHQNKKLLKRRGINRAEFYTTPKFLPVLPEDLEASDVEFHIWKAGDRFFKLAAREYGDPTLWWVIAYINRAPTEGHVKPGDQIIIPRDITIIDSLVNR